MESSICWRLLLFLLLVSVSLPVFAQPPDVPIPCPRERAHGVASPQPKKGDRKEEIKAYFRNDAGVPIHVFWCDYHGQEVELATLHDGEEATFNTDNLHIFNVRTVKTGLLVHSLEIQPPQLVNAIVKPCTGVGEAEGLDTTWWPEFERLAAAAQTPCAGEDSSKWSCVREVSQAEADARDPTLYGFSKEEAEESPYTEGTTRDTIHKQQQKYMPNVTHYDGGYLHMRMPDKLKDLLFEWYNTRKEKHLREHEFVPGYFTNNHKVPMDKLDLEHFHHHHRAVVDAMREIMQWWTQKHLKHTITFGARIYKRGSMLINHLDRKQSHLVSAILQVHQGVDKNGGWPVEVLHPHRTGLTEIYLQPGEMVLYEGARLEHGRPMRFRGEEFVNIFSHFVPVDYRGPQEDWRNPHLNEL